MNIQQIVYFLALSEEPHFTRAAKRCGIAQPSLTNAIRALEAEFGARLFHRRPKPRLSELGSAVRPDLQRALILIERALTRAQRAPRQSNEAARPRSAIRAPHVTGAADARSARARVAVSRTLAQAGHCQVGAADAKLTLSGRAAGKESEKTCRNTAAGHGA